jgi:hypothetical protein
MRLLVHSLVLTPITIDATTPDKIEDTVVYKFCIPA